MTEPRTARQIAEQIILSHVEDIEWGSIGEMMEDEAVELGQPAWDELRDEVDDLIRKAVVTVSWTDHDPHGEADHG